MYIEKETLIIRPFIKKRFLNQSLSTFTANLGKADFNSVMEMIKNNKSPLVPNRLIKSCEKEIRTVFDSISNSITKDNCVDKDEVFDFVKRYYNTYKRQNITNEQIKKLSVYDFLDILIVHMKKLPKNN